MADPKGKEYRKMLNRSPLSDKHFEERLAQAEKARADTIRKLDERKKRQLK